MWAICFVYFTNSFFIKYPVLQTKEEGLGETISLLESEKIKLAEELLKISKEVERQLTIENESKSMKEAAETEEKDLLTRISNLEKEKSDLQESLSTLEKEKNDAHLTLKRRVKDLEEDILNVEKEKSELQMSIQSSANDVNDTFQKERNCLQEELNKSVLERQEALAKLEQSAQEIEKLQSSLKEASEIHVQLAQQVKAFWFVILRSNSFLSEYRFSCLPVLTFFFCYFWNLEYDLNV